MSVSTPRSVVMAAFQGANLLDISGPLEVFAAANEILSYAGHPPYYHLHLTAEAAGPCVTSSGIVFQAESGWGEWSTPIDTLFVAGSPHFEQVRSQHALIQWVKARAGSIRRIASVCTGTFILAEAGLLNGRPAATHWLAAEALAEMYPEVDVQPNAIFVGTGGIYCSAGVTAGMDLALALVEEDLGAKTALACARMLVMYVKRPGGQDQYSVRLKAQEVSSPRLAELLNWLGEHFHHPLKVEALAARAAMSPRTFARVFVAETGTTPAKFIEHMRMEHAMQLLEAGHLGVDEISRECGFTSAEQFRRTFIRHYSISPAAYRERFAR